MKLNWKFYQEKWGITDLPKTKKLSFFWQFSEKEESQTTAFITEILVHPQEMAEDQKQETESVSENFQIPFPPSPFYSLSQKADPDGLVGLIAGFGQSEETGEVFISQTSLYITATTEEWKTSGVHAIRLFKIFSWQTTALHCCDGFRGTTLWISWK